MKTQILRPPSWRRLSSLLSRESSRLFLLSLTAAAFTGGMLFAQPSPGDAGFSRLRTAIDEAAKNGPFEARFGLMGPVVKNQPYYAEATTESTQTLADGTHIRQKSGYTICRDVEGRMRRESPADGHIMISDPVGNVSYMVNTASKTVSRMPLGRVLTPGGGENLDSRFGHHQPGPSGGPQWDNASHGRPSDGWHFGSRSRLSQGQPKTENLGTQTIEGVAAEGTRTTVTIPEGTMGNDRPLQTVTERWYSHELQVVVMSRETDPRHGETVYRLSNVRRGPPDPSLFQPPAGYQTTHSRH